MSYLPWFPEPGSYIRYMDYKGATPGAVKYRKLTWRRDPLRYPRRLVSVAAGSKGDALVLDELNPSADKKHLYLAYLGFKPGFLFYLWHPFDIKLLKWDERITDIDEDLTATMTYEESPYEFPVKSIGIERDRYPAVQARNISPVSMNPEVIVIASQYKVVEHEALTEDELAKLQSGAMRSYPWDFGGEL